MVHCLQNVNTRYKNPSRHTTRHVELLPNFLIIYGRLICKCSPFRQLCLHHNRCITSGSWIYCKLGKETVIIQAEPGITGSPRLFFCSLFQLSSTSVFEFCVWCSVAVFVRKKHSDATQHLLHTNALPVVGGCDVSCISFCFFWRCHKANKYKSCSLMQKSSSPVLLVNKLSIIKL